MTRLLKLRTQLFWPILLALFGLGCAHGVKTQAPPGAQHVSAFDDFSKRLNAYIKLHKDLEASLPPLKPSEEPEKILAHQQALAQKIAEARREAKPGDIFTPEVQEDLRKIIHKEFKGPKGRHMRKTIRQGEPLTDIHWRVNDTYPPNTPFTTVPPSLLIRLPSLPKEVEYRIVGRDLLLLDSTAKLVVDFIHEAIP